MVLSLLKKNLEELSTINFKVLICYELKKHHLSAFSELPIIHYDIQFLQPQVLGHVILKRSKTLTLYMERTEIPVSCLDHPAKYT